jgi:hypothetical protein
MKLTGRCVLALTCALSLGCAGCAMAPSGNGCTETPFIQPTTVTLDHTVAGNSQQFKTGINYAGGCAIPALLIAYTWNVSNTTDASITSGGVASCNNAALNPITVYTTIAGYSGTPPTLSYAPSGLPSATLVCK